MKRIILLAVVLTGLIVLPSRSVTANITASQKQANKVYVCMSPNAYAYHAYQCQGLRSCKSDVVIMTVSEAIARGRRACGYCY